MGRGRQRAKEKKVARRLKYYTPETDYEALQRELAGQSSSSSSSEEDEYARIAKLYDAKYGDPVDDEDEHDDWDTLR